jgi:sulfur carrier protein
LKLIEVTINGATKRFAQSMNVAIERNGDIVPRSQFEAVALASGDQLEIVVAVGGG